MKIVIYQCIYKNGSFIIKNREIEIILQMYVYILNSYFADFGNIIHGLENAY